MNYYNIFPGLQWTNYNISPGLQWTIYYDISQGIQYNKDFFDLSFDFKQAFLNFKFTSKYKKKLLIDKENCF